MSNGTGHAHAAADLYRGALERNLDAMSQAVRDLGAVLRTDERPVCTALEPRFIDGEHYDAICRDTALVVEAGFQLARAELEQRGGFAVRTAPKVRPVASRLDGMLGAHGFALIEANPLFHDAFPWGIGIVDALNTQFADLPTMRDLRRTFQLREVSTLARGFDSMMGLHARRAKTPPVLAVIDVSNGGTPEAFPEMDYVTRIQRHLTDRGCKLLLCDANTLHYDGHVLRAGDIGLDLIVSAGGDETAEVGILALGEAHPAVRALADGAVTSCDAFPMGPTLGEKSLFERLLRAAEEAQFDAETVDAVTRLIPWTREVRPGSTVYRGERLEVIELLFRHQEDFVLKPIHGCGGRGVHFGWQCDAKEWKGIVDDAFRDGRYVAQQRIISETRVVTVLREGHPRAVEMRSDFCPYTWSDGSVDGCLVRIAEGDLLNVTGGATVQPLYVVDGLTNA